MAAYLTARKKLLPYNERTITYLYNESFPFFCRFIIGGAASP